MLAWAKRTSQVIDCEAIGGSGGWKGIAQNWAGEERTRTFGLIQAAPYEKEQEARKQVVRMSRNVVLKKEVKAFVWGSESLLAAVESGSEFSSEELHLIDLYAEVIQQTSAAGLFH